MSINKQPLISICITTYNHESFIRRTLEGVFNQTLNHSYEVLIYNDASTDNSDAVIREMIEGKSNVIYKIQNKNKGISGNFTDSIKEAKGKYVAVLDGDDYWIDKNKLQIQINFLEKHSDYAACFTDTLIKNESDESLTTHGALKNKHKRNISLANLTEGGFWIPTSTFVYRNKLLNRPLPKIYQKIEMVDIFLFYLILEKGTIAYLDKVTAVYRKHDLGEWSGLNQLKKIDFRINNKSKMKTHFKTHPLLGKILKIQVKNQKKQKHKFKIKQFKTKIRKILKR